MDSAICFTQWNVGAVASGLRNLHTGLSDETMKPFQWGKEKDWYLSGLEKALAETKRQWSLFNGEKKKTGISQSRKGTLAERKVQWSFFSGERKRKRMVSHRVGE